MAVQRRDPGAGRPLRDVPRVPTPARPVAPPRRPASPARLQGPPAPPVLPLVLPAALLTLGVTLLRLVGELLRWSPQYFSRLPGGGLSPVGITWLVPLVGLYLGWRLERSRLRPPSLVRAAGWPLAALAGGWGLAVLVGRGLKPSWTANLTLWGAVAVVVAVFAYAGWPALGRALAAYALLARVPVAIVMALAVNRGWGTHYDVPPPGFPAMPPLRRWLWIGLVPQMTIWVAFTIAVGVAAGSLGFVLASRRRA
jgi:hypothetical protein